MKYVLKKIATHEKVQVYQSKVSIIEQHYYLWEDLWSKGERIKHGKEHRSPEESWCLSPFCSVFSLSHYALLFLIKLKSDQMTCEPLSSGADSIVIKISLLKAYTDDIANLLRVLFFLRSKA